MKRLLMYSQDGMGLGHLRRVCNIAAEIRRHEPDCDILVVTDSPAASLFCRDRTIECVKLPTIVKTGAATWENVFSLDTPRVIGLRANLILEVFRGFEPDTVLVDHMPVGALGELKPMLDLCRTLSDPPRLFLGLRDVLDSEEVVRHVWSELGSYDYLPDYEAVLIYGCQEIYDTTAAYGLEPASRQVVYCGYVAPGRPDRDAGHGTVRSRALQTDPFVLMMGGGGHDSFSIASTFVDIAPTLWQAFGLCSVLLTGPNMSPPQREALVARATSDSILIEDGVTDAAEWIRRSSVVLSMAGYNSLCELLVWRKKALVVPRAGPSAEQLTRSRLFSERGLIRMLDPDHLTPLQLGAAIGRLIRDEGIPDPTMIPPLDGAQRSAGFLLNGGLPGEEAGPVLTEHLSVASAAHGWGGNGRVTVALDAAGAVFSEEAGVEGSSAAAPASP